MTTTRTMTCPGVPAALAKSRWHYSVTIRIGLGIRASHSMRPGERASEVLELRVQHDDAPGKLRQVVEEEDATMG